MSEKDERIFRYAGFLLAALAAVVVFWGLFGHRDTLVIVGLITFGFGIVVGRLEGPFQFGPSGVKGNLPPAPRIEDVLDPALQRRLEKLDVDDDTRRALQQVLLGRGITEARTIEKIISAPPGIAIASGGAAEVRVTGVDAARVTEEAVAAAADEFADDLVTNNVRVYCANGHELDEPSDLPPDERKPCPHCGSLGRRFEVTLSGGIRLGGSLSGSAEVSHGDDASAT